ncbi:immunity protein YezG family protein [Gracilibacillus lacisalsi]|uniref:immunity protein YezG family protein n=1 Tax=Gracilibacillus lacisalsi TaxID=393087 RepID=UPI0003696AF5|nr:immunity protein YezG family protein [Gracilibacillus lacisalsi]
MSFELELNKLFEQIAQHVNDIIPVEWSEFYFNGEVKNKEGGVFFFFTLANNKDEPVYSHDIPDLFQKDESVYDEELHKLFELTVQLQQIFIDNDQEPWFSVTIIVNDSGKLNVHFDYTNWHDSEFGPADRIDYFEYKYLSSDKGDLDLIKRMEEFEKNNTTVE